MLWGVAEYWPLWSHSQHGIPAMRIWVTYQILWIHAFCMSSCPRWLSTSKMFICVITFLLLPICINCESHYAWTEVLCRSLVFAGRFHSPSALPTLQANWKSGSSRTAGWLETQVNSFSFVYKKPYEHNHGYSCNFHSWNIFNFIELFICIKSLGYKAQLLDTWSYYCLHLCHVKKYQWIRTLN